MRFTLIYNSTRKCVCQVLFLFFVKKIQKIRKKRNIIRKKRMPSVSAASLMSFLFSRLRFLFTFFRLVVFGFNVCGGYSLGLCARELLHYEEEAYGEDNADSETDNCVLYEACDDVHYEGNARYADSVRKLSRNVVEVVTLTARTRHNGGIGDG